MLHKQKEILTFSLSFLLIVNKYQQQKTNFVVKTMCKPKHVIKTNCHTFSEKKAIIALPVVNNII